MNNFEQEIELLKEKMTKIKNTWYGDIIYDKYDTSYKIDNIGMNILKGIWENYVGKVSVKFTMKINKELSETTLDYKPSFVDKWLNRYDFKDLILTLSKMDKLDRFDKYEIALKISIYNYKKMNHLNEITDINYTSISAICKTCGMASVYTRSSSQFDKLFKQALPDGYCCVTRRNKLLAGKSKSNEHEFTRQNFAIFKKWFETESPNANKLILKDMYTLQCRNRHIFRLKKYMSSRDARKDINCWICESNLDEKYEFFKLLKELGTNYYIQERDRSSVGLKGFGRELNKLLPLNIFTYNDKKHLTGKIVFDDLFGEQQAKANSNKLVFRWFDIKMIDNNEYCRVFFADFFQEIINRNKIKGDK